jgi:hypothetical protein
MDVLRGTSWFIIWIKLYYDYQIKKKEMYSAFSTHYGYEYCLHNFEQQTWSEEIIRMTDGQKEG